MQVFRQLFVLYLAFFANLFVFQYVNDRLPRFKVSLPDRTIYLCVFYLILFSSSLSDPFPIQCRSIVGPSPRDNQIQLSPFLLGPFFIFLLCTFCTFDTFPPDLYRSVLESTSVQSRSILESTSIDKLSLGSFLTRLSLSTQTFYRLFSDLLPVIDFLLPFSILVFYVIFAFSSASVHAQKSGKPFIGLPLNILLSVIYSPFATALGSLRVSHISEITINSRFSST